MRTLIHTLRYAMRFSFFSRLKIRMSLRCDHFQQLPACGGTYRTIRNLVLSSRSLNLERAVYSQQNTRKKRAPFCVPRPLRGWGEEKSAWGGYRVVVFRWNHAFATRSVLIFWHMLAFRCTSFKACYVPIL